MYFYFILFYFIYFTVHIWLGALYYIIMILYILYFIFYTPRTAYCRRIAQSRPETLQKNSTCRSIKPQPRYDHQVPNHPKSHFLAYTRVSKKKKKSSVRTSEKSNPRPPVETVRANSDETQGRCVK